MIKLELTIIEKVSGLVVSSIPEDATGTQREAEFAAQVNEAIGELYGKIVPNVCKMSGPLPDDIAEKFAETVKKQRHFRANPGN